MMGREDKEIGDRVMRGNHAAGGVFDCLYDEHFTLLDGQANLCAFLGYTPEEMEENFHNHMLEFIYNDDRELIKAEIDRQLASGNVFMYENRLNTKKGEIRWIWISAELRQDPCKGRYFHCIFHDITNSRQDQEKLALSEQRYEIVLSQMQDIVFELDCQNFDIYYSPNFVNKFGYQIPVKGFPDSMFKTDIVYEQDKAELRSEFQSLLQGEQRMHHEFRIKHKDGFYLWMDIHATAMRGQDGRIIKILGIISDIDKRKTEILETKKMANLDPLTGLSNRRGCVQRINRYIEESDVLAAFLIIDIDNFKMVNDTKGHLYGDSALTEISEGLLKIFRRDDVISRFGGDEFVVFLPQLRDRDNVLAKLEAIRQMFQNTRIFREAPFIGCSIGVSYYPEHGTDFTTLFAKADAAMYYAKKHGKGQYCIYREDDMPVQLPSLPRPMRAIRRDFHSHVVEYIFRIFLETPDYRTAISSLLGYIGRMFRADNIYICQRVEGGSFRTAYTWSSEETHELEKVLDFLNTLDRNKTSRLPMLSFDSTQRIADPRLRQWFESRGVKAAFWCWLGDPEKVLNFFGIEDCQECREGLQEEQYALFMVSQILSLFLTREYDEFRTL